jgi:hypothetical protein
VHVAHVATSATTPAVVANGGVACRERLLRHLIMRWVAKHVGRKGRDKEKKTKNISSPAACPGEEEEETMPPQNSTVSSLSLSVFFLKCMERRRFAQNAPFHLNENWRQSARFQANPSICVRFAFWSLVSDFFN